MILRLLRPTRGLDWLAALFLFLLLHEWLLPLPTLTDTGDMTPFYYVVASVVVLDMLIQWRWLAWMLKALVVLWMLHSSYFVTPFFGLEWLTEVYVRLAADLSHLFTQNWLEMSPISRNFWFYVLLVMMVSILSYLVLEQRRGLWFVFLTEVYLATLDTFMPYQADGAIMRGLIAGFLLLAVIHFAAVERMASSAGRGRQAYWKSLVAPLMIISLAVGVAYAAPKKAATWSDPIAYFTGANATGTGTGVLKKVGYDNDDHVLGGPFQQDNALVFIARTNEKSYWRGDAKDFYTGRGWAKITTASVDVLLPREHEWGNMLFDSRQVETKDVKASLEFHMEKFSTLFYLGQITKLVGYTPPKATLSYDIVQNHVEVRDGAVRMPTSQTTLNHSTPRGGFIPSPVRMELDTYELEAQVPVVSEKKMISAGTTYPNDITNTFLQLPGSVTPRVHEFTKLITKDAKTPYEKVRAIENHLRISGQYKYETKDVPVPPETQDFVDHFLFETKRGYCDHFSTSMTVMLRSIGIPARWVKGFAPGTEVERDDQGNMTMEVRNRDAHSWVEVYFPNYGWMPFEATTSFASPLRVNYDLYESTQQQATPESQQNDPQEDLSSGRDLVEDEEPLIASKVFSWGWLWYVGLGLALLGFMGWRRRNHLFVWWMQRQMATYSEEQFAKKFSTLVVMYERVFMPRESGETLREYFNRLHVAGDAKQDLQHLTQLYERVLYGLKEVETKAREIANQIVERLSQQMKP